MSLLSFIATAWQKLFLGETAASQADDGQSVLSSSNTLLGDSNDAQSPLADRKRAKMDASSSSFAKVAKQEGWGAPTATRPSLVGV